MANISELNTSYNLNSLISDYDEIKYNPSSIVSKVLTYLENVTDNKVDIIDPTNPFVLLLEASAVNTAAANQESLFTLRKLYPILAQTESDLYRHMSDKDYLDRFSTPSSVKFKFLIEVNSLKSNLVKVEGTTYSKVTICRDTIISVNDIKFTLQYPIDIKVYESGVTIVTYDAAIGSPLQQLSTNILPSAVYRPTGGGKWLMFELPLYQFEITTYNKAVTPDTPFKVKLDYTDRYYYCRIYHHKGTDLNTWYEMETTHTDQVFDTNKPTAVLTVEDNILNVEIPIIYTLTNMITGNIRIDIYTTKGELQLNLSDYALSSFSVTLNAIDTYRDTNKYTLAMSKTQYIANSSEIVTGGSLGIDFEQLKYRVVNNSVGNPSLPITNIQLVNQKQIEGFEIIRNIDSLTNRIYVASKPIPKPLNEKLVTSANVTIKSLVVNIDDIEDYSGVYKNNNRVTISTDVIYKDNNDVLKIIPRDEVSVMINMNPGNLIKEVNTNRYLYSPFHYVLDCEDDLFEVRAYYLDNPTLSTIDFCGQNYSIDATVNTSTYYIRKYELGYELTLLTKSNDSYKAMDDNILGCQLAFKPSGENQYLYINGTLLGKSTASDSNGERIFRFLIDSNFDLDKEDKLYITNGHTSPGITNRERIDLKTTFTIFYSIGNIPVGTITSGLDKTFAKWMYSSEDWLAITQESIEVYLGDRLKNLWCQSRSIINDDGYVKHGSNVPMRYTEDVYEIGDTGTIIDIGKNEWPSYTLLHKAGDIVYDNDGNIVYEHLAGDIVLDEYGNRVLISNTHIDRIIDLTLIEGAYYFTTDENYIAYRHELTNTLKRWVVDDLSDINNNLLEQTHIYYRPKSALGTVEVQIGNNNYTIMDAEQSFKVVLYVKEKIYKDEELKNEIETNTVKLLNSVISEITINITDIIVSLKELYGDSVITFDISGLGGDKNFRTVTMTDTTKRLSLKKVLTTQIDNTIIVKEDIEFVYVIYGEDTPI